MTATGPKLFSLTTPRTATGSHDQNAQSRCAVSPGSSTSAGQKLKLQIILHKRTAAIRLHSISPLRWNAWIPSSVGTRSRCFQTVINVSRDACIEILRRLLGIPAQFPTTVAPRARVRSHLRKVTGVIIVRAQVGFGKRRSLWGCNLAARIKCLSNGFDRIELLVFSVFEEVESLATGIHLFPRHDRVEEDIVESADLRYFESESVEAE